MKTAVVYARFSSDNQRQESIDAQLRAINEYCKKNEILIKATYTDEARSATTDQRDQFLQMIQDCKTLDVDYCIVHKLDRFSRNRYDSAFYKRALKQCGVRVISVLEQLDDSPESIILESVLEGMSEYYSKNLAREVKKGLKENALVAKHNGGTPPLGYDVDKDGHYVINPTEALAVRKIFDMYIGYYGFSKICSELNEEGYKTKRGYGFRKNSIHDILCNEKYIGTYVYNKRASKKQGNRVYKPDSEIIRIQGAIPRIISDDVWKKAQEILKQHKHRARPNKTRTYILTGKIVCGECGSAYTGAGYTRGGSGKHHYQYMCVNKKSGRGCPSKAINAEYLEQVIINEIRNAFTQEAVDNLVEVIEQKIKNSKNAPDDKLEKELKSKLSKVKRQIQQTWDLYYSGNVPQEQFAVQIEKLNKEQELLTSQLSTVQAKKDLPRKFNAEAYKREIYKVLDQLQSLSPEAQIGAINLFIKKIIVNKTSIEIQIRKFPSFISSDSTKKPHGFLREACLNGGDEPITTIVVLLSSLFRLSR